MSGYSARLREHARTPLYRNAYALMLSGSGSAGFGMLFWILASRYCAPAVVGVSSAAIAAFTFVSGLSALYLDGVLYRFVPRAGRRTGRLIVFAYAATFVSALFASTIFLAGVEIWSPELAFLASSPLWVLTSVMAMTTSSVMTVQDGALTGLRETLWVPAENLATAAGRVVLMAVLGRRYPETAIVIAWVVPSVFALVPVGFVVARFVPRHATRTTPQEEDISKRDVVRYAAGNYAGFLCILAYRTLPPLLVLNAVGRTESGFFYLPWVVTMSLMLLTTNISVSLVVEGAMDRDRLAVHVRHATKQAATLILPIVGVLVVIAPFALRIFGERYADEGTTLLRLLAIGLIPAAVCTLSFGVARVRNRVRALILYQALLAAIILSLVIVLVPRLGIEGAGIAWLVGQTVVSLALARRELWSALMPHGSTLARRPAERTERAQPARPSHQESRP